MPPGLPKILGRTLLSTSLTDLLYVHMADLLAKKQIACRKELFMQRLWADIVKLPVNSKGKEKGKEFRVWENPLKSSMLKYKTLHITSANYYNGQY